MDMSEVDDLYFLEQLLTFSIPRADTNPIAHNLLKKFKTIDNIFEADESALQETEGVGQRTAYFLKYMLMVCYKYNKAKATKTTFVGTYYAITKFLRGIIPPSHTEQVAVVCINKNYEVKNYEVFKGVNHSLAPINAEEIINYLTKNKFPCCIIAHTHPGSSADPSSADMDAFVNLKRLLAKLSIDLVDNIILGEDEFYSSKLKGKKTYKLVDGEDQKIEQERESFSYTYKLNNNG